MSITIHHGDCLDVMAGMEPGTFDAIVTDPPYGLTFMGRAWDRGVPGVDCWREAIRVTAPGGYLVAFGGARTHHRMACAIEDAGWEIRDCIMWLYGTGFPKGKAQLKPAHEPIVVARKPGPLRALGVDECRIRLTPEARTDSIQRQRSNRQTWEGGVASGFSADHVQPMYNDAGRWPANVAHDGSDEVMEAFAAFGERKSGANTIKRASGAGYAPNALGVESRASGTPMIFYGDTGSAARFFYCSKASASERAGARHPTIKPLSLMEWLVKLVTPPGGLVLDPFAGSGTTGLAARNTGRRAVLIEREAEYIEMIYRRVDVAGTLLDQAITVAATP